MRKLFSVILLLCAVPTFPQSDAEAQQHVKYSKYQRKAAGFWRVTETPPQGVSVKWLVIGLGDSQNTLTVRWPTGVGCQTEAAEIQGDTITVVGGNFPAVIQIRGRKTATLSMSGGQTILHLRKTQESVSFVCE